MRVKALLEEAVAKGVVPGVAFGVVFADGRREAFHLGLAQREPEPVPLEAGHLENYGRVLTSVPFGRW